MKIAFFEIKDWEKKYLQEKLKKHKLMFFSEELNDKNVKKIKGFDAISVFIYSKITAELLANLPKLKLITTRSTGFDHIDVSECERRNIIVCTVPFYGENTVAEHTFALILSLSRNVHKSYVRTLKDDYSIEGLQGFDLKGKTIGVIGAGHIGLHVIRMAKGFGMNVLAFDLHKDNFISEVLGFEYATMNDLLKNSDIVTLHAPYNEHTHHLINKDNIKLMKKGAILINTARGGLIDTEALLEALENKHLGGAGLDVIEGEEFIKEEKQLLHDKKMRDKMKMVMKDHLIFRMDNVVFTPHNAFNSCEALIRILDTTIENIEGFSANKIRNKVVVK